MTTTKFWRNNYDNWWNEIDDNFVLVLIVWFVICQIFVDNVIFFLFLFLLFLKSFRKSFVLVNNICFLLVNTIIEFFVAFLKIKFRFRWIFWIEFVFESQLQRLFDERQNKCDKSFDERLILIFLILINKIFELIKRIIEWRSIKERKEIVDIKLLKKIVLSFSILLIDLFIKFVDIVEKIDVIVDVKTFDNHFVSKRRFEIKLFEKTIHDRNYRELWNLHSKIKIKIVSRQDELIKNKREFDDFNVTHDVLYVLTKCFVISTINHDITLNL